MMPLRALLLCAGGLLSSAMAGFALAAPQHALTLGTFRQSASGGFDSLNPFISKGVPADDIGLIYDTLARQGMDEPFTEYGLVAAKIEKAPDNQQLGAILPAPGGALPRWPSDARRRRGVQFPDPDQGRRPALPRLLR